MRVMFCAAPGVGHLFPLVSLAWAFRAAGHDVVVTVAEHSARAAAAGLEVVDVAPGFSSVAVFEEVARDYPDFAATATTKPVVDVSDWAPSIAAVNRRAVDRTVQLADEWEPDLVVYDQGATAGLFGAARRGVPAVQRNLGGNRTGRLHKAVGGYLQDLCERYRVVLPEPDVTLEAFPPSMLQYEPEGWFTRWVTYSGGAVLDDWLTRAPERPRIAITLGTIELQTFGVDSVAPLLAAAAGADAEFVLALGDVDISPLGELPPNVRSVGWVPLHVLLRTCAAVVHHGGSATTITAVDSGVPQLAAVDPRDQMQHVTCNAIRHSGVGLVCDRADVTSALLERLVVDDGLRAATAAVRAEIAGLPSPAVVVDRIADQLADRLP
ncbi:UDP:flavonoid glycosyltransferase YjiC (YdhE family) [Saccharothrix ecbatanensis]|uniref:UDP:flavonoid glycosyltransferase YjiC (YdhE family) n=1 Tax=Saccharothrix ecbatanensis TaxID=1105145 RepID=A0A7W9M000_9PSEU|nr:nucleotide disphospho-sugar-binding domain-containing protein [Saccharothrix ecbatanensis]MBB5802450.1 UDP:flavonoid glycosyltransferase YjiC (YdhE family) [Saccharothrix ecbatanensis]